LLSEEVLCVSGGDQREDRAKAEEYVSDNFGFFEVGQWFHGFSFLFDCLVSIAVRRERAIKVIT
jgi:hypothetical protein